MKVLISVLTYNGEWVGRRYAVYSGERVLGYADVPSSFAGEFEKLLSRVVHKAKCSKEHIVLKLGKDSILRSEQEPDGCVEISSVDEAISFINGIKEVN